MCLTVFTIDVKSYFIIDLLPVFDNYCFRLAVWLVGDFEALSYPGATKFDKG